MKLPAIFERYRTDIDRELRSSLAESEYSSPMYDMLRYHMGWKDEKGQYLQQPAGKALRPTLCLLAGEAMGGDLRRVLPAAAAVELIHNFSLIHDDVQDNDRERRHRPTVWSLWGKPQAINAGTAMRVVASLTLLRLAERDVFAQKQLRPLRLLDTSCLQLIEGQYLDIDFESRLDVSVGDYHEMILRKTASLIACSLELGAFLSVEDELAHRVFREFGLDLGLAFQIRDDVLGIWGDEEKTGKPVGNDIRRRKKSLPIVYALQRSNGATRAVLTSVYLRDEIDEGAVARVLEILEELDAEAYTQGMAEKYRDSALDRLRGIELPPWGRDNLEEIAHFLTIREF